MQTLNSIAQEWVIPGLGVLLVLLLANFIWVFLFKEPKWILDRLGASDKFQALKFLGLSMGGILFVIQIVISSEVNQNAQQALRQERQKNNIVNQNAAQRLRQEQLQNAIEHLGNRADSVRLGGAYELFHLAKDNEELRQTVLDILCAHIRGTTAEGEYRMKFQRKPSEEIQTLLSLLFVQEYKVFESLNIKLQESWLNGANLQDADLRRAELERARLQRANLEDADLRRANLSGAHLQGANLQDADLRRAELEEARLQVANLQDADLRRAELEGARLQAANLQDADLRGTDLRRTLLQEANFWTARLQEAKLHEAQPQGACLKDAHLEKAKLRKAQLQGANLEDAHLEKAKLREAQLQRANLEDAHLQGAVLKKARLQGVLSKQWAPDISFAKRMRSGVGKESDFSEVVFSGGLKDKDIKQIVKGLLSEKAKKGLRKQLEFHIDKPASNQLPEESGAITEPYSEKEAEQWIAEYEEAMSEVPKEIMNNDSCRRTPLADT